MSEQGSRARLVAVTASILVLAAVAVWVGASRGPANSYLSPQQARRVADGHELTVMGVVVDQPARPAGDPPVVVLASSKSATPALRVQYVGLGRLSLRTGEPVTFIGKIEHQGLMRATGMLKPRVPATYTQQATSP